MDLADALSKGDIAAAARIAMKAKQDSQKAALDDAKANLENARKAELESITVSILGQTEDRQSLEEKIEKNTATIAANKLVELDRQVAIGKNAVIAADAAQRTLEANLKMGVLPKPYNPTYGGTGSDSSTSSTTSTEPTVDLPTIGADSAWADEQKANNKDFWANIIPDIGTWLGTQWTNLVTWLQTNLTPEKIGQFIGNIWNGIKDIYSWLKEQSDKIMNWFGETFSGENIGKMAGNLWNGMKSVGAWLAEQWENLKTWFKQIGPNIGKWAKDLWEGLPDMAKWLGERVTELKDWVLGLPGRIWQSIVDGGKAVGDWFGQLFAGFDSTQKKSSGGTVNKASGGLISGYANGGSVVPRYFEFGGFTKQGTDTIPAMLTPGEFVMKKSAVDSIGVQELSRMNTGGKDAMPGGESVYNYSITVNANSSDSSDIADKVLREIQRIDSQRIRSSNI
jgi:hypothetical protein